MDKLFQTSMVTLGTAILLLFPSNTRALGPMQYNSDPTLQSTNLGDQTISGQITLIETWNRCVTIDRGNGNIIRVIVDADTQITKDGFPVDFRDLVAGNNVTINQPPAK